MRDILNIIQEWQTLTGILLGSFMGALMSFIVFYFENKFKKLGQRKEGRRRIEIATTRTITDIYNAKINLLEFIKRTKMIITNINKVIDDDTKYILSETNLPPISLFLDETLPNIQTKSYYIHNKLLYTDASIKSINATLKEMKEVFSGLSRKNELLINLKAKEREQKEIYLLNLQDFNRLIEQQFIPDLDKGIKILTQIKVYNSKMRGKQKLYKKWKHEGISCRYFKTKQDMLNHNQELTCINRIDSLIESEVEEQIKKYKKTGSEETC